LIFSFVIELLQLFNFVEAAGLQQFQLARVVLGTSFAWADILAYTLGIITVLIVEFIIRGKLILQKN
jgi:hypothetical protein